MEGEFLDCIFWQCSVLLFLCLKYYHLTKVQEGRSLCSVRYLLAQSLLALLTAGPAGLPL